LHTNGRVVSGGGAKSKNITDRDNKTRKKQKSGYEKGGKDYKCITGEFPKNKGVDGKMIS